MSSSLLRPNRGWHRADSLCRVLCSTLLRGLIPAILPLPSKFPGPQGDWAWNNAGPYPFLHPVHGFNPTCAAHLGGPRLCRLGRVSACGLLKASPAFARRLSEGFCRVTPEPFHARLRTRAPHGRAMPSRARPRKLISESPGGHRNYPRLSFCSTAAIPTVDMEVKARA
ncbi:hypothetical protein VTK26DRAFT_2786 [Humicola hyalothermophila]